MNYVNYKDFNPLNLTCDKPKAYKPKVKPGEKAVPDMHFIQLKYNYGTDAVPKYDIFLLEFCRMTSYQGIVKGTSKKDDTNTENFYADEENIRISFDLNIPEQVELFETLNNVYIRCTELFNPHRNITGKHKFKLDQPEDCADFFVRPTFYPINKDTGERIPDRNPMMSMKVYCRGFGIRLDQTLFHDEDSERVDKSCLTDVSLDFTPCLAIRSISANPKNIKLSTELKSAIIHDIIKPNYAPLQIRTLEEIKKNNNGGSKMLQSKLAKKNMETPLAPENGLSTSASEPNLMTVPDVHEIKSIKKRERKFNIPNSDN